MKITQEADYSLRIVLFLSKLGFNEKIEAKSIADQEHIPIRFLLKILRKLTKAGIVKSFRGVNGGYSLNKRPEDISLREVIEVIDGPICVNRCTYDEEFCTAGRTSTCEVHKAIVEVQSILSDALGKKNFRDLIKENR